MGEIFKRRGGRCEDGVRLVGRGSTSHVMVYYLYVYVCVLVCVPAMIGMVAVVGMQYVLYKQFYILFAYQAERNDLI